MPTIEQFPLATSVATVDLVPISQGGSTKSLTVANLLGAVQPAITVPAGALVGSVATSAGAPGPVTLGTGLTLSGGVLAPVVGTTSGTVAAGNDSRITGAAPLASPAFTGTPTAPTAAPGISTTQLATTAFVATAVANAFPLSYNLSDWTRPGDASASDAFNRIVANAPAVVTGIRIYIPPSEIWTFDTPLVFPGAMSIAIEGEGPWLSQVVVSHNAYWLTCEMTSTSQKVILKGISFTSTAATAATLGILSVIMPVTNSSTQSHVNVENISIYSTGSNSNQSNTFYRAIRLQSCWSSRIRDVQMQGCVQFPGVPNSCMVELGPDCVDTWIRDSSYTYGHCVVLQTGYCEGVRLSGISSVQTNFLFDQDLTQLNSAGGFQPLWPPYTPTGTQNTKTINELFVSETEATCYYGGIRITNGFLILGNQNHWQRVSDIVGQNYYAYSLTGCFNGTITGDIMDGGSNGVTTYGVAVFGTSTRISVSGCNFANTGTRIYFGSESSVCHAEIINGDYDVSGLDFTVDLGTNNTIVWRTPGQGRNVATSAGGWVWGGKAGQPLLSAPDITGSDTSVTLQAGIGSAAVLAASSVNANATLNLGSQGAGSVDINGYIAWHAGNLAAGTAAGTFAAGNDARITGALSTTTAASTYAALGEPASFSSLAVSSGLGAGPSPLVTFLATSGYGVEIFPRLSLGQYSSLIGTDDVGIIFGVGDTGNPHYLTIAANSFSAAGIRLGNDGTVTLAGTVTAPTPAAGDNTTKVATTAFVIGQTAFAVAGGATTANVPAGQARVVKDTAGGGVHLVYNDGGTLRSAALT